MCIRDRSSSRCSPSSSAYVLRGGSRSWATTPRRAIARSPTWSTPRPWKRCEPPRGEEGGRARVNLRRAGEPARATLGRHATISMRLLTGTGLVAPPKFPEKLLNDNREVVRVLEFVKHDRQADGRQEVRFPYAREERRCEEDSRQEGKQGDGHEDRRADPGRGGRSRTRRQEGLARC